MTELEKCMAGEWYDCHSPEFIEAKARASEWCARYNATPYSRRSERRKMLEELFGAVGSNVSVGDNFQSSDTPSVDIDDNANIHSSLLATTEHVLNLAGGQQKSFPVQVQYVFRGTYFQRDIDTVECGGMIDLLR